MQNQTVGSYMPRLPRAQKRRGVLLLKDLATNSRNVIYNTFSLVNMKQLLCFTLGKHIAYYSHSVHFTYDTRLCTPAFFSIQALSPQTKSKQRLCRSAVSFVTLSLHGLNRCVRFFLELFGCHLVVVSSHEILRAALHPFTFVTPQCARRVQGHCNLLTSTWSKSKTS